MPLAKPWIQACLCLPVFVLAWAGATLALTRSGGFPQVPGLSEKREIWQARRAQIDTVFVGSSRTFHHLDPVAFAEAVAAEGLAKPQAFNAGADLMFPPESFRWVRELLAARPEKLKWVFLEFAGIREKGDFGEGFENSARGVWWHDGQHTRLAVDHVWRDERMPWLERADQCADHLSQAAQVATGAGRRGGLWSGLLLPQEAKKEDALFDRETGFLGYAEQAMSGEDAARYREQLAARLAGQPPPVRTMPADLRAALKELAAEVRRAGAELVLIEPPESIRLSRPMKPPPGVLHLGYNAVEANQEWYAPEARCDGGHMVGSAAKKFSARVGRDFAALVKQRSAAPR